MKSFLRIGYTGVAVYLTMAAPLAHAVRLSFEMPDTSNNQNLPSGFLDADYPAVYGDHVTAFSMTNSGIVFNYGSEGGITDQIGVDYFAARFRKTVPFANMTNAVSIFSIVNRHVYFDTTSDPNVSLKLLSVDVGILADATGGRASTSTLYVAVFTNNTTEIWRQSTPVFGTNAYNQIFDFTTLDDTGRSLTNMKGTAQLYFVIPGVSAPGSTYGYDNIIFTQIPEPSALLYFAIGLGGWLCLRRRQR